MKKIKLMLVAAAVSVASAILVLTGCTPDETLLVAGANTAGNLAVSAWFAIDDPDENVKTVLKDVVTLVGDSASSVGEGTSYVDALTPVVQEFIVRYDTLTPAQMNLINTGASVVLSALDTFIDSKPELKGNMELVNKVVAAFCKGCLTAIERSEDCCSARSIKKAHQVIRMRYDASAKAFTVK